MRQQEGARENCLKRIQDFHSFYPHELGMRPIFYQKKHAPIKHNYGKTFLAPTVTVSLYLSQLLLEVLLKSFQTFCPNFFQRLLYVLCTSSNCYFWSCVQLFHFPWTPSLIFSGLQFFSYFIHLRGVIWVRFEMILSAFCQT